MKNNQSKATSLSESDFIRFHLDESESSIKKYAHLVIGEYSLLSLIKYEFITLMFGWIPGALGLALRKIFYPLLFKRIGRNVVFGRNTVLRNTARMYIGDSVVIDDDAFLDARGAEIGGFVIGNNVLIGRGATLQSKIGGLKVGAGTSVGSHSTLISQGGITIANDVFIGGGSKISGGLFKMNDQASKEIFDRYSNGPITIEERCVIGMGCIIIDNVHIGSRTLVGSGAIVSTNVPEDSIVGPRPPLVMKKPNDENK